MADGVEPAGNQLNAQRSEEASVQAQQDPEVQQEREAEESQQVDDQEEASNEQENNNAESQQSEQRTNLLGSVGLGNQFSGQA
jgi:hypothetical protein